MPEKLPSIKECLEYCRDKGHYVVAFNMSPCHVPFDQEPKSYRIYQLNINICPNPDITFKTPLGVVGSFKREDFKHVVKSMMEWGI